ncbi:xylose isomerase [candidate division MSBL1 archaeon SCGC-AAA259O05]|uniref:Xylose isomerase n=1 Tax=candidate division MSBL1 archaeon SCGC-AAA259O05 TaxID=1698271 RepID=A0A133UYE0_9EURY|nr:xylose isomerase [candidate division MSBL1 archaeon SCGC-AAA259O05]
MKLGGPIHADFSNPEEWISYLSKEGYEAAYCPVDASKDEEKIEAYSKAAEKENVIIAEVGAWSNPISPEEETRKEAIEKCKEKLELADKIGARCCVNIAGSRGEKWDGPHHDNFAEETFQLIVETIREIIDYVEPKRTYYTLETMPWIYPNSPDEYLELLEEVDRDRFAVHFDPVNIICSPKRYFNHETLIKEFIEKIGPHIKSCHLKDIKLRKKLTVHLNEVRPGKGKLNFHLLLKEIDKLKQDLPVMLEHLSDEKEYRKAADHVRSIGEKLEINL